MKLFRKVNTIFKRKLRSVQYLLKILARKVISTILKQDINTYISHLSEHEIQKIILNKYLVWGDEAKLSVSNSAVVNNAYFNLSSGIICIEDWVFFGNNVSILTGKHDYNLFGKDRQSNSQSSGRDVIIKRGVWVASNATIIGPCIIGENSVIAACSLVIDDVRPYTIVAGIPAKVIKEISH